MIEDYESGLTPNPDIVCNREIKFGWFLDKCLASIPEGERSSTWIATGMEILCCANYCANYCVHPPVDSSKYNKRALCPE